ncbi:MAG: STAS domain-containing protein [candidate division KSB1 bacterium]|nr:STAS domain-containing protein [candidate division KSB1 bacterium]MDZ7273171.1 STAS domain-containing protein [candidate division KSB1 bacterium]MDZ7285273.1 STAS domain-containing protein [candidate division KSB1 bacterium]MDZ7298305.1 STAS domain-containing protein [candidate division KSB1 bacterium]MDZ7307380.1 STAS domain-containing protein [candidate division KSB1 bacterium]
MSDIQVNLRLEDKLAILDFTGDVTSLAERKIVAAYERANTQKLRCLLLNFSGVGYINSAGMSIIITLLGRAQQQNLTLKAFGLSPHFQKIFAMVGLLKYIPHFASEAEARASCTETAGSR